MARLVRIWIKEDRVQKTKTAIIGSPGRKFTKFVTVEYPIRVRKIPNSEVDRSTSEIPGGSLPKALRRYRKIGRTHGMTKGAKKFLREARA